MTTLSKYFKNICGGFLEKKGNIQELLKILILKQFTLIWVSCEEHLYLESFVTLFAYVYFESILILLIHCPTWDIKVQIKK